MGVIAVKRWVLDKLYADKKWSRRADKCKSQAEYEKVLVAFCMKNGIQLHHEAITGRLVQC